MFDLSMVELGVIALVALLVLGPERLPKAARTLGFYVRKARQSWYSVRAEFERELAAEELKRSLKLDEVHATLDDTARSARDGLRLDAGGDSAAAGLPAPGPESSSPASGAQQPSDEDGLSAEERARQSEPWIDAAEQEPIRDDSVETSESRAADRPEAPPSSESSVQPHDPGPAPPEPKP